MAKKKSNKHFKWALIIFSIFAIAAAFGAYQWWKNRKARFVRYPAFGILIPEDYMIHGIDVSKYQETIAWDMVKEMKVGRIQLGFAFIKATEGVDNIDPQFKRNWKKSKQAGIIRGAYHFFLSTKDGRMQAENFINTVDLEVGDMPPVVDIEQTYGVPEAKLQQRVREWLDIVEEFYGVRPIIYTNVDFYKQYLEGKFDDYPLWVAHYVNKGKPRIYRDWHFWQYSETGRVNGILSRVDFNVFNGDSTDFQKLLIN